MTCLGTRLLFGVLPYDIKDVEEVEQEPLLRRGDQESKQLSGCVVCWIQTVARAIVS